MKSAAKLHHHHRTEQPSVSSSWGPCRISQPFYRSWQGSNQIIRPSAEAESYSYQTARPSALAGYYYLGPFGEVAVAVTAARACSSVFATAMVGAEAYARLKLGQIRG